MEWLIRWEGELHCAEDYSGEIAWNEEDGLLYESDGVWWRLA